MTLQPPAERIQKRNQADRLSFESSLAQLAAVPLGDDARQAFLTPDWNGDPLLAACRLVGKASRISVRAQHETAAAADALDEIAKSSGFRTRLVELSGNWWRQDNGPLLAFTEDGSPVALIPESPRCYRLHDPASKASHTVSPETAARLRPTACTFYRPLPDRKLSGADLLRFGLDGCRADLKMILLMGIAGGLAGLVPPIAAGIVFDTLIPGAKRGQLAQMFAALAVCALSAAAFQVTRHIALLRLEGRVDAGLQAAIWDRLLNLPARFFRDYSSGDLAVRAMGIDVIRQTLTGAVASSLLAGVFSFFSFCLLFCYQWRLALLATLLAVIGLAVTFVLGYFELRCYRALVDRRGDLSGLVLQLLIGIAKFRVSGTESRAFAKWASQFAAQRMLAARARAIASQLHVFHSALPLLSSIALFWAFARVTGNAAAVSTGDFIAFSFAFAQFLGAMLSMSSALLSALSIVPVYERIQPILTTLPEVRCTQSHPGKLAGRIEISHVSFRYKEDAPPVLKDFSLRVNPGEFVALVGASGCGKSTLLRLLLGFEEPESGAILYDGQNLSGLDVQAVRRQIGVVLQSGKLMSGDILSNILGSSPLTLEDAWEAARMAGLDRDIEAFPMGMQTVIGESGGGLSGGQRQRLLIARAIVNRPKILFFDEATSALDNQTQATVSHSLERLQATRIVIAHRLSTVVNADRIVVMDRGAVVQCGPYRDLIAQEGPFAALARRQIA
jgi:NHLM bacteriocin system ABC transporter ATP-binding protein